MGLLRDLLIKDEGTKRKVTILIDIIVILGFIISVFTPFIIETAYEQGFEFGRTTCIEDLEFLRNISTNDVTQMLLVEEIVENGGSDG